MKLVLSISLTFVFLFSGCGSRQADVALSTTNAPPAQPVTEVSGKQQGQQGQATGKADSLSTERYIGRSEPVAATAAVAKPQASGMPKAEQFRTLEPSLAQPIVPTPVERKVIQNGEFTIETKSPIEDQRKIAAIASSLGGFVVTSEFQQSASQSTSTVSVIVRVPAANFQKATEEIRKLGIQVIHEKLTGQDVTAEYIDLEARLRAKKALEAQYFEIMKRASKISDVLEVQEKLTEVRTAIEQDEGRRRYLDNQSALSTINISLQTPAPLVAATQTGFWASVKNSFGDGVDVTVAIVLGLIHFVTVMLPVVVLILLPAGLIARVLWKRISWPKKEPMGIVPPTE